MPAIYDSPSERPTTRPPKKKRKPKYVLPVNPEAQDRARSKTQKAHDQRIVNRNIAQAKTRARVTPDQADRLRTVAQKAHDAEIVAQNVKLAREMYLRKRGAGSGARAVKRELEGHGLVAGLAGAVTKGIGQMPLWPSARHVQLTGGFPRTRKMSGIADQDLVQRTVNDAVNVAAQAIPSAYQGAAASYELTHGRPQRLKKLVKDAQETDPVYNAAAAGVELARGKPKSASEHWKKSKKAAAEHPGFTALELYGGKGVVGRGAGALVRGGARATGSETLKRVGTTKRAPRTLPGTNIVEHRTYSKDLISKAAQAHRDRAKSKQAGKLRSEAANEADPKVQAELRAKARRVDPHLLRDKDIGRRVDESQAMAENVRRIKQADVLKVETKAMKQAAKGGPIASLLAQRITRPTIASLRSYRDDLKAIQPNLKGAKLVANRQLVHDLDDAISKVQSGKVSLDEMRQIADRYAERNVAHQQRLANRDIYAEEQSQRRAVIPFAVRELGVARDKELLSTRATAASKQAKKTGRKAKRQRGRTAGLVAQNKRELKRIEERMTARPLRSPEMLKALKAIEDEGTKRRETEIKKATTRHTKSTKAAQKARDEAKAAKALRTANPMLRNGQEISTKQIIAALEQAHGEGAQAAVISQRPPQRVGGGDFFRSGLVEAKGEKRGIGGAATREGGFDASPEAMLRQQTRSDAIATQSEQYADFMDEFGRRYLPEDAAHIKPDKRDKPGQPIVRDTRDAAQQVADDLSAHGDIQWVPAPTGLRGEDTGPWGVIPAEAAKRKQGHLDALAATTYERGLRSLTSGFQRTVLATSLPWMVGNTAEASVRAALNRAGPGSWARGRQYLKALEAIDSDQKRAVSARTLGGGQGAFLDRTVHANLDNYADGLVRDLTAVGKGVRNAPVAKQIAWFWDRWTHHTFNTVNKTIEQQFQTAMLGRAVKEQLMSNELKSASKKAIEEFASDPERGLSRNTAVALGREIDKMYGRYEKFSPDARSMIARYTPFAAWLRNAIQFLATAAERHPTSTVAATAMVNATEEDRKAKGQNIDLFKSGEGNLPNWLQGSIPDSKGGHYRLTRFTPMSLATDPLGAISGSVLPQFKSALYAMNGLDWTGKPLKGKDGQESTDANNAAQAIKAVAEATVPFLGIGTRVAEKGLKSIPQSAVGYSPPSNSGGGGSAPKIGGSRFTSGNRFKSNRFKSSSRFSSRFK